MPLQVDCLQGWEAVRATSFPEALKQQKNCLVEEFHRRYGLVFEQLNEHCVSASLYWTHTNDHR